MNGIPNPGKVTRVVFTEASYRAGPAENFVPDMAGLDGLGAIVCDSAGERYVLPLNPLQAYELVTQLIELIPPPGRRELADKLRAQSVEVARVMPS
jgi:hypothetical protein